MVDPETETVEPDTPEPEAAADGEPIKVPEDHPLVKTLEARKAEMAELRTKLKTFEDAQLSEQERLTRDRDEANARAAAAEAELARLRVASAHGISVEDAELFLTGTDEETLVAQAKRLATREADRKRDGQFSPGEGSTPGVVPADPVEQFAEWAKGQFTR